MPQTQFKNSQVERSRGQAQPVNFGIIPLKWDERSPIQKSTAGQAMLIAILFFVAVSLTIILGLAIPVLGQLKVSENLLQSKRSFFLAEAGISDVAFRVKSEEYEVSEFEEVNLDGFTAQVEILDIPQGKLVISEADLNSHFRKIRTRLVVAEGTAFNYGVQVGEGGLEMGNGAAVIGNVYSNGNISMANNSDIFGTAIVAFPNGINNGNISEDVHAEFCSGGADIDGTLHLYSSDPSPNCSYSDLVTSSVIFDSIDLPISDEEIDGWKDFALDVGGVCGEPECDEQGNYLQEGGTSGSLGPIKIEGDLNVGNGSTLELTGTIWVTGDVFIDNNAIVSLSEDVYGSESGMIIADGEILLANNSNSFGSGQEESYIMYLSTSDSPKAIEVRPGDTSATIVYANEGTIVVNNNVDLLEVVGYRVFLENNAQISYEIGLADTIFTSGPGGVFQILNWREIK